MFWYNERFHNMSISVSCKIKDKWETKICIFIYIVFFWIVSLLFVSFKLRFYFLVCFFTWVSIVFNCSFIFSVEYFCCYHEILSTHTEFQCISNNFFFYLLCVHAFVCNKQNKRRQIPIVFIFCTYFGWVLWVSKAMEKHSTLCSFNSFCFYLPYSFCICVI